MHDTAIEDEVLVQRVQRLQRRAHLACPGRQCRPRGMYTRASVDGLLPIVRQVIREAADRRVRQLPTGGDAPPPAIFGTLGACLRIWQCLQAHLP